MVVRKTLKWFSFFALLFVLGLVGLYAYIATSRGKRAEEFSVFAKKVSRPLVIAHRGGAGIAPENTLEAFRRSYDLGVDVLELDIRATSDGKLIVIHDRKVDRTTEGSGNVSEMIFDEIRKLDAGFRWTRDGGKTFPFRGKGIRVPTLREVFDAFPDAKINIEAKHETPSPVKHLCNLIREFDRADKSAVASLSDMVLKDFRSNCKGVATSASLSESRSFLTMYRIGLSKNYSANMQALQIPKYIGGVGIVTREFVQAARERNLQLHVWTVNKKEEMKRLIDIGVDGIMTDYPDDLLELVRESDMHGKPY